MRPFLVCTVYAPMASWGDIAVGELRGSWDRPSRSGLLGLIAAALGLAREDREAHGELGRGLGLAVRVDRAGTGLVDYHTTQTIREAAVRRLGHVPRRELLVATEAETILSRRAYLVDALATAVGWQRAAMRWPLEELRDALRRPRFALYAGRKAFPLGLPLNPRLVDAPTLAGALQSAVQAEVLDWPAWLDDPRGISGEVSHDRCDGFESGLVARRRELRRDDVPDRERWLFEDRVVEVGVPPSGGRS